MAEFGRRPTATSTRSKICAPPGAFFPSSVTARPFLSSLTLVTFVSSRIASAVGLHALGNNCREIAIGAGQQAIGHLDHGHFRAERRVHRAELQTDIAAADDEQTIRHVRQLERRCRIEHLRAVDRHVRHRRRPRSGGDDDVVGLDLLFAAGVSTLSVLASTNDARPWMKVTFRDFASRPSPPVCFLTTSSFQPRSLSMSIAGLPNDTPNASACFASSSTLAACSRAFDGMQPRNVQTPPGFGIGVDERDLHAEICGMKRRDIAARACTNDCESCTSCDWCCSRAT